MSESDLQHELRIYVEVFNIPAISCPPDYFTLLDLDRDCSDVAAIKAAAKSRASCLNKSLPSELHLAARKILRRMERAIVCLSDPSSRAAYLAKLDGSASLSGLNDLSSASSLRLDAPSHIPPRASQSAPTLKPRELAHTQSAGQKRTNSKSESTIVPPLRNDDLFSDTPARSVLDLGPTTHAVLVPPRQESKLPLYTLIGAVGFAAVAGIAFALFGISA